MTHHPVREQWVDAPRVMTTLDQEPVTMATFAFEATGAVLVVEPRLAGLALLVDRCASGAGMDDETWRAVDALAATLVGPGRSVSQVTAVNAVSRAVGGDLRGEVVRRRFCEALRRVASEAQEGRA